MGISIPLARINITPKNMPTTNISETIVLKLGDHNIYYKDKMSDNYPLPQ